MVPPVFKVLEPVLRSPGADGLPEFLSTVEKSFAEFARSRTGFLAQLSDYVLTGSGKRVRPGLVFVASRFGSADPAACFANQQALWTQRMAKNANALFSSD